MAETVDISVSTSTMDAYDTEQIRGWAAVLHEVVGAKNDSESSGVDDTTVVRERANKSVGERIGPCALKELCSMRSYVTGAGIEQGSTEPVALHAACDGPKGTDSGPNQACQTHLTEGIERATWGTVDAYAEYMSTADLYPPGHWRRTLAEDDL